MTLPTSVTFDENGTMYAAEGGFAYGGLMPQARILKIENSHEMQNQQQRPNISVIVDRHLNSPITDIEYHEGKLYISHKGIISTVDPSKGIVKDIITGLPSIGDHHNNQIAFGPDGRLYFGVGTATNSGVVGEDSFHFGWLQLAPTFHDTPGANITLKGQNFVTSNVLSPNPADNATTGAFSPFGNSTANGKMIEGVTKCNGCIISANPDGDDLKVVAWGLRNPFGLAFSDDNKLLVTMNGADERGSRPIANDTDKMYLIDVSNPDNIGKFYGWPDFFGNAEPVTDPKFKSPRDKGEPLQFLMQEHPPVVQPLSQETISAALTQADFIRSGNATSNNNNGSSVNKTNFGYEGKALISEFGNMVPVTHSPEGMASLNISLKQDSQ